MAKGVLDGIRIISMGSAWAGPYVGRVLAEMGAEVLRVSFPERERTRSRQQPTEVVQAWRKK